MKFYTLRHIKTGQLPEVSCKGNEGSDFCNDYRAELFFTDTPDNLWLTRNIKDIDKVLGGVPWYNSGLSAPEMPEGFFKDDYVVVQIEV